MDNPVTAKAAILQSLDTSLRSGTEIATHVRELTRGRVELRDGSVYPALQALRRARLVVRFDDPCPLDPPRGGRPRQLYGLTEAGKRAAEANRTAVRALFAESTPGLVRSAEPPASWVHAHQPRL